MVLYKRKEIRFIVSIAVLLFFPLFCNAAATEEPEEEILFITSYNSDTKYTYDNISTFIETYTQLGGRYSTIVENMNATDLTQAHQWKKTLTDILDKHPKAKLVILLRSRCYSLHFLNGQHLRPAQWLCLSRIQICCQWPDGFPCPRIGSEGYSSECSRSRYYPDRYDEGCSQGSN